MISLKKKFLFVHIPKTGGSALQIALQAYTSDNYRMSHSNDPKHVPQLHVRNPNYPDLNKHSKLRAYRKALDPELYDSLFKFSCVRNPWYRAMSFYFSPHRGTVDWNRTAFIEHFSKRPPMIKWVRGRRRKFRIRSVFGRGQNRDDPPIGVDLIMRYESLERDFRSLSSMLGLPDLTLPRFNVGPIADYDRYYDEELIQMVGEHYREDIEAFGYEPPCPA